MEILSIQNITKLFSDNIALDNISLSIEKGTIHGLLGPNGAGKTTLLRIINQITLQDKGVITIDNHQLRFADNKLIGYLPEERGLYPNMKVKEHIRYFGELKGLSPTESAKYANSWLNRFDISHHQNRIISELSKGNQQKVQIICALVHNPSLLLFDEPFSGFDPVNASLLTEIMHELSSNGTTIILSSHNMTSVEELCKSITLINKGKSVLSGNVTDIKTQYKDNSYSTTLSSTISDNELFQIIGSKIISKNEYHYIIKKKLHVSNNDVIKAIMEEAEIIQFNEILPSLNEIFIKCVNSQL